MSVKFAPILRTQTEFARVVELVDTQDLKSCDHCDRAGSIPAPGTDTERVNSSFLFTRSVPQTQTATQT